jgi:hypothetical protein
MLHVPRIDSLITPKRILLAGATLVSAGMYVWFAAVRAVPDVRRRKAEARRRR